MGTVLVPDYFADFHCKCGECRHPCCDGWGINIDEHEYFTLLGIACSKRLRNKLDDAFVMNSPATKESFASIRPNYLEQCPMLDDDGLCLLQKEKGEDVLPLICRVYPRAVKKYGDLHEVCMSCSCEATVELLMKKSEPLTLGESLEKLPFDGLPVYEKDPEKDRMRHAVIAAMSDFSIPIEKRVGIVASIVASCPMKRSDDKKTALEKILSFIRTIERGSESMRTCADLSLGIFSGNEDPLPAYLAAEKHLYEVIPDLENVAGRIISNHLLYESFPYTPGCQSPDDALAAFLTALAMLKVLAVGAMAKTDDLSVFADTLAFANRFVEHSDYYRITSSLRHPSGAEIFSMFSPLFAAPEKS